MLDELLKLEMDGYIRSQKHNTLPLTIYNYSAKTQYESYWTDLTSRCRALVTDSSGKIVCNPLPKFHNWQENKGKYSCNFKKSFKVYDKLDGSYIQVFLYDGQLIVTSRGSFHSDQAVAANKLVKQMDYDWQEGLTYIFELVGPSNQIVLQYPQDELILLAVRDCNGDLDIADFPFKKTEMIELNLSKYKDFKKLKHLSDKEGYVILFEDGNRVKFKFSEYVERHRWVTGITSYVIWESLRDGKFDELLEAIPDEVYDWVKEVAKELKYQYFKVTRTVVSDSFQIGDCDSRKEFAELIKDHPYKTEMFLKYDCKSIDSTVWKRIKPEFQRPTILTGYKVNEH